MKTIFVILIGLLLTSNSFSQTIDTLEFKDVKKEQVAQTDANGQSNPIKELKPISSWEFALSLIVLGFGILVLAFEVFLVLKLRISEDNTVKFIIVTLIITATLYLITAGYDNNQIAPAVGLLGTIAGYLLGRQDRTDKLENGNSK